MRGRKEQGRQRSGSGSGCCSGPNGPKATATATAIAIAKVCRLTMLHRGSRPRPCYWQSKRVLCAKGRTKGVGGGCMWTNGKNAIKRTPRKLCVGVGRQVQLQLQVAGRVPKEAAHSAGKNVSVTLKTKDKAWQHYTTHTMRRVATLLRAPRTKLCKSK